MEWHVCLFGGGFGCDLTRSEEASILRIYCRSKWHGFVKVVILYTEQF